MTAYTLFVTRGWYDEAIGTLDTDDPAAVRLACELIQADAEPVMTAAELDHLTRLEVEYHERHI